MEEALASKACLLVETGKDISDISLVNAGLVMKAALLAGTRRKGLSFRMQDPRALSGLF